MYLGTNKVKINTMVSVAEASSIVFDNLFSPGIRRIPITDAVGCILAEEVSADRSLPPSDRVTMDGIALAFRSWAQGQRQFVIQCTQPAGVPRMKLNNVSNCIEVMTGAVLPEETDTVIPYEDLEIKSNSAVVNAREIKQGQNVHRQGSDARRDELLLSAGICLSPAEIALLASVGRSDVNVFSYPETAIISSGDEIVPIDFIPGPHQVRRSNSYAIHAAMKTLGWNGNLFHLADDKEQMIASLTEIAGKHRILILSGGVSKGKFDFVPEVMEAIGVSKLFHRVNQKPGKPFWFGASSSGHVVFALPGNPVSTYMCFYRYIRPWAQRSLRTDVAGHEAFLAEDFKGPGGITYFLQVSAKNEGGKRMAYPCVGGGSGDFANLKNVTGFLEIDGSRTVSKGDVLPYFPFRHD